MEDRWIYLPDGGYPKSKTKVNVLVLSRSRDPYYDRGKPGRVYSTTGYFLIDDDGKRNWYDVILDDDMGYAFINEYDCCEDYDSQAKEHPNHSYDAYIVAWQPMPEAPENIVWPERKPVRKWRRTGKCPVCKYVMPKDADPNDTLFCPRCGKKMMVDYVITPETVSKRS